MTHDRAKLIKPYGGIPVNTEGDVVHRRPDGGVTVVWDGYNCEHPMKSHEVRITEKMGTDSVYIEGEES